jgi:small subunit ribosomal protein S9
MNSAGKGRALWIGRYTFTILQNRRSLSEPMNIAAMLVFWRHRTTFASYKGSSSNDRLSVEQSADVSENSQDMSKALSLDVRHSSVVKGVLVRKQRPMSSYFFTGQSTFYDLLHDLDTRIRELEHSSEMTKIPTSSTKKSSKDWASKEEIESLLNVSLKTREYCQILERLNLLSLQPNMASTFQDFLSYFKKEEKATQLVQRRIHVDDEYGRAHAIGKRKEASAKVCLIAGTGEWMVNEQPLHEYFPRIQDRKICIAPLELTNRLSAYNMWCLVKGGGHTGTKLYHLFTNLFLPLYRMHFFYYLGQSGAIQLGISRALCIKEPELRPHLRQGKCS